MTEAQFAKKYGQRLRAARTSLKRGGADISLKSIAAFAGVSVAQLLRWERGDRLPTVWQHHLLIELLGPAFDLETA
ncbi:helix-turn-helix domain-containing protein [Granulicella sp. 5B5]|uniref:helix-turn-helix domain-containing protein n=1 Tax=Granulicella sp. 5B5 TaxID=1617967 RepID=UPI0015F55D88|nr:helix-turn-helix transcriptional regulator [Granulicella sp. 5B5]QMV19661.1 helix-turn-helix domain-containing protein [Granulicella sp. 5B5]